MLVLLVWRLLFAMDRLSGRLAVLRASTGMMKDSRSATKTRTHHTS
jgi:hypothetical protein